MGHSSIIEVGRFYCEIDFVVVEGKGMSRLQVKVSSEGEM